MNNDEVTLFITACNRADLLEQTLQSFIKFNTYPIKEAIIIEDSGLTGINDFAINILPFSCKIIYNESRIGQMKSIEKASEFITTPYVFHCEEDWEFYDYGFIEKSFEILKKDPIVINVFLRSHHEMLNTYKFEVTKPNETADYFYIKPIVIPGERNGACGILSFNPGLRTTEVQKACMPYKSWMCEGKLGYYFYTQDKRAALTNNSNGYIRHIGWERHVW
jgi:hypothetical protein